MVAHYKILFSPGEVIFGKCGLECDLICCGVSHFHEVLLDGFCDERHSCITGSALQFLAPLHQGLQIVNREVLYTFLGLVGIHS